MLSKTRSLAVALLSLILGVLAPSEAQVAASGPGRAMASVPAPKSDECITDVSPGDHTFSCTGLTYKVTVDPMCLKSACGLIFDIHGAGMSADVMRANTELNELAPPRGYLVVHPSASPTGTGSWTYEVSGASMADFMKRMVKAFHVDEKRIHVTGFSMGAAMTFWFLCNHPDRLASVAVVTGSSADQVKAPGGEGKCIDALNASWSPRVPIFFFNGIKDPALTEAKAQERTDGIVSRLSLKGGEKIAGDDRYTRRHWTGAGGMEFDFLTHDYAAEGRLAGHCMPGGRVVNATTCNQGDIKLHWGKLALEWFMAHPKP
jgi:poly(3-hydroxybutyrate) depolymerase